MLQKKSRFILVLMLLSYTTSSFALSERTIKTSSNVVGAVSGGIASYMTYRYLKKNLEEQHEHQYEQKNELNELIDGDSDDLFADETDDLDDLLASIDGEYGQSLEKKRGFGAKEIFTIVAAGVTAGVIAQYTAQKLLSRFMNWEDELDQLEDSDECSICHEFAKNRWENDTSKGDLIKCPGLCEGGQFHKGCIEDHVNRAGTCPACNYSGERPPEPDVLGNSTAGGLTMDSFFRVDKQ